MVKTTEIGKCLRMKIVKVYKDDKIYTTLSKQFEVSRTAVRYIIKNDEFHTVENRPRTGRKRKISPRLERKIVRDVIRNSHVSAKEIVNDLETTGLTVSTNKIARTLHRADFGEYRPR